MPSSTSLIEDIPRPARLDGGLDQALLDGLSEGFPVSSEDRRSPSSVKDHDLGAARGEEFSDVEGEGEARDAALESADAESPHDGNFSPKIEARISPNEKDTGYSAASLGEPGAVPPATSAGFWRQYRHNGRLNRPITMLPLAVAGVVFALDVAVKWWIQDALGNESFSILPWLHIWIYHNHGVYLGTLPVASFFVPYWAAVVAGLTWFLIRTARPGPPMLERVGFGMALGGLAGNAADRISGGVVDYVMLGSAVGGAKVLVFNLADVALMAAVAVIGISMIRERRECAASRSLQS